MTIIQDRISVIGKLIEEVKQHPTCLYFEEHQSHYLVIHPAGYWPEATRVTKSSSKSKALAGLLIALEDVWDQNSLFTNKGES